MNNSDVSVSLNAPATAVHASVNQKNPLSQRKALKKLIQKNQHLHLDLPLHQGRLLPLNHLKFQNIILKIYSKLKEITKLK